ncbi:MAG: DMT family transporter [Rhodospirillales bacterium]
MTSSADRPVAAILLIVGATLFLVTMDACIKWLVADYPVSQLLFMRSVIGLLPTAVYIWLTWQPGALVIRSYRAHALRTGSALIAMFAFFTAIAEMELAAITSVVLAAPVFITLCSALMLGERVGWRRWAAVVTGFVGVVVILQPTADGLGQPVTLLALVATLAYALMQIFTRRYARSETAPSMMLSFAMVVCVVTGLIAVPDWRTPPAADVPVILIAGFCYGIGVIVLTLAYRLAEASLIAPFDYLSLPWAILIGYLVWGDIPTGLMLSGAAIIAVSGIFILRRQAAQQDSPGP